MFEMGEDEMNEDALIRELKRKTLLKNRNIMVGRVFLSACLEAMTEQRSKIRRLQEALDAANREAAACKAENDRLNRGKPVANRRNYGWQLKITRRL